MLMHGAVRLFDRLSSCLTSPLNDVQYPHVLIILASTPAPPRTFSNTMLPQLRGASMGHAVLPNPFGGILEVAHPSLKVTHSVHSIRLLIRTLPEGVVRGREGAGRKLRPRAPNSFDIPQENLDDVDAVEVLHRLAQPLGHRLLARPQRHARVVVPARRRRKGSE